MAGLVSCDACSSTATMASGPGVSSWPIVGPPDRLERTGRNEQHYDQ